MSITEIAVDLREIAPDFITSDGEYSYQQWTDTFTNEILANLRACDPDILAVTVDKTPLRSASDKGLAALLLTGGLVAAVTAGATYDPAKIIKLVQAMWETLKKCLPHSTHVCALFDDGVRRKKFTLTTDQPDVTPLLAYLADIIDTWESRGGRRTRQKLLTFAPHRK